MPSAEALDKSLLLARDPILFYDEVPLYESELDDNGASQLHVKVGAVRGTHAIIPPFVTLCLQAPRLHPLIATQLRPRTPQGACSWEVSGSLFVACLCTGCSWYAHAGAADAQVLVCAAALLAACGPGPDQALRDALPLRLQVSPSLAEVPCTTPAACHAPGCACVEGHGALSHAWARPQS